MSKALVLIIDDEPQIQKMIKVILKHADYDVIVALTGQQGLTDLVYKTPNAVLLDMELPDMEGSAVLVRIGEISDAAVIMVSVRGQEEIKRCLESGADDYVTRPFSAVKCIKSAVDPYYY